MCIYLSYCIEYISDKMKLLNELVTPFNIQKEVDIDEFNHLLTQSLTNHNDYTIIFSYFGDGHLLSSDEMERIISSISSENLDKVIFYFQLRNEELDNRIIDILQHSKIKYVLINPPLGYYYTQEGLFLYLKKIIKKLHSKKIFLQNSPLNTKVSFHFHTLRKLIKIHPNLIGIYENSNDFSLLSLLKHHFPDFKILLNEININVALEKHLDGIVSLNSIVFGSDYQTIIDDYSHGFNNKILIDYLKLVHEILYFSNNSTLIKAYLKRLGYKSMETRLPLIITEADEENLDLLLS